MATQKAFVDHEIRVSLMILKRMHKQSNEIESSPIIITDNDSIHNLYSAVFLSSNCDGIAIYAGLQRTMVAIPQKIAGF